MGKMAGAGVGAVKDSGFRTSRAFPLVVARTVDPINNLDPLPQTRAAITG
jgi:hypothetical protein